MMNLFSQQLYRGLSRFNQGLNRITEKLVILMMALLVLDVLWGVFSRFVLGAQSPWTEELARFILVWLALFGSVLAFRQHEHLGMDVLTNKFHPAIQRWTKKLGYLMVGVFALLILLYGGWALVANTWNMKQSMIALPLPKYFLYLALPISGITILFFMIEYLLKPDVNQQMGER